MSRVKVGRTGRQQAEGLERKKSFPNKTGAQTFFLKEADCSKGQCGPTARLCLQCKSRCDMIENNSYPAVDTFRTDPLGR